MNDHDAELGAAHKREQIRDKARYVVVFVFPLLMVGMMISGYLGAMSAPKLSDLPVAVVGDSAVARSISADLGGAEGSPADVKNVDSAADAQREIRERLLAGALVVSETDRSATLYTAQAAGPAQASSAAQLLTSAADARGLSLTSSDIAPLPRNDSAGLAVLFMAIGLMLAGYMPFSLMLSTAPELLTLRRIVPMLLGWSALTSFLVWFMAGPIVGAVHGHAAAIVGVGWVTVFAVGCVQLFLLRILGPLATLAAMLFVMVLGTPASNLGTSVYTMPEIFRFLHEFLPMAAAGEALRSVLYFDGVGVGRHLSTLAIGAAVALVLVAALDTAKRRRNPNPAPPTPTVPSLLGKDTRPRTAVHYTQLALFPLAMITLLVGILLSAMHSPEPRNLPVAVVGASVEQADRTIDGLEESVDGVLDLRTAATIADAERLVRDQQIVAAYVLPGAMDTSDAVLITASAAGTSQKQTAISIFDRVAAGQDARLDVRDIVPLATSDSAGTAAMYLAIGWAMSGFLVVIVISAGAVSLMRPRMFLPVTAVWSIFMSTVLWIIAGPVIGALPPSTNVGVLLAVGAMVIFAITQFTSVFTRMIGLFAVVPVIATLMFLGVPSSGGALSLYLQDSVFLTLNGLLPLPAALESARSILYFDTAGLGSHLMTLCIWGLFSLAAGLLIARFKTRREPDRPMKQSDAHHALPDQAEVANISGS